MKAILLIIGCSAVLISGPAWAVTSDETIVKTMPYDPQGVPLSISPAEQEDAKKNQAKKTAQKREDARKKAIEVLGEPEPASRAPDLDSNQGDDTHTNQ